MSSLDPALRVALSQVVDEFLRQWHAGLLEATLSTLPPELKSQRVLVLHELVKIDLAQRWQRGEHVALESYLDRFPQLGSHETVDPELIMTEWTSRQAASHPMSPDELEDRFPQQAAAIRQRLRSVPQRQVQTFNEASPMASSLSALPSLSDLPPDQSGAVAGSIGSVWESNLIGQAIGQHRRYRIEKKLGGGGMGAVYLAFDVQERMQVAIKVPHLTGPDRADLLERFRREALLLSSISHPNLGRMYALDEFEGRFFHVMEYIVGKSLATYMKRKQVSEAQAVTLVRKLALAMAETHRQGVIHRDLKPDNIMLSPPMGEPKIIDFGLALKCDGDDVRATRTGQMMGTPYYMPIEQIAGDKTQMGPSSDIYSLGVILYELLAGIVPFPGRSAFQIIASILRDPAPLLSTHRPDIDPRLEVVVMNAIAKQPADRFASMDDFAEALRTYRRQPLSGRASATSQLSHPRDVSAMGRDIETLLEAQLEPLDWDESVAPISQSNSEPLGASTLLPTVKPELQRSVDSKRLARDYWHLAIPLVAAVVAFVVIGLRREDSPTPQPTAASSVESPEIAPTVGPLSKSKPPTSVADVPPTKPVVPTPPTIAAQQQPALALNPAAEPGELKIISVKDIETRWHWIPPGQFKMGSPLDEQGRGSDEAQVDVTNSQGFWMLETEVTQELWIAVMGTTLNWDTAGNGSKHPVYNVSHIEATAFCAKLNPLLKVIPEATGMSVSLPTEAQWEYAARAGTTTRYYWGDSDAQADLYAWHGSNSSGAPQPVSQKKANPWGLHDMSGNVWEWCGDRTAYRMRRGGSWLSSVGDGHLRSAVRSRGSPGFRSSSLGFRLASGAM